MAPAWRHRHVCRYGPPPACLPVRSSSASSPMMTSGSYRRFHHWWIQSPQKWPGQSHAGKPNKRRRRRLAPRRSPPSGATCVHAWRGESGDRCVTPAAQSRGGNPRARSRRPERSPAGPTHGRTCHVRIVTPAGQVTRRNRRSVVTPATPVWPAVPAARPIVDRRKTAFNFGPPPHELAPGRCFGRPGPACGRIDPTRSPAAHRGRGVSGPNLH